MWLDRLAAPGQPGHHGSQPHSRSISPLPRRPSGSRSPYVTSQRAGISPRGSSLSLLSNDSSSSLPGTARRANGSALKQSTTVDNGPDPEVVLEKLLGPSPNGIGDGESQPSSITERDLDFDFDFGGWSLTQLAHDDTEQDDFDAYRPQTVEECRLRVSPALAFGSAYSRRLTPR